MSRFSSALCTYRNFGIAGIFRKLAGVLYSKPNRMWLLEKIGDNNDESDETSKMNSEINFRQATCDDIETIAAIWPPEFGGIASKKSEKLLKILHYRFESELPCFVACENEKVISVAWCKPWYYDKALPYEKRDRNAYEICNLFTIVQTRGRGASTKLLLHVTKSMARKGKTVAYSRIMLEREVSFRVHEKAGFHKLGLLTLGCILGYRYCHLVGPFVKKR